MSFRNNKNFIVFTNSNKKPENPGLTGSPTIRTQASASLASKYFHSKKGSPQSTSAQNQKRLLHTHRPMEEERMAYASERGTLQYRAGLQHPPQNQVIIALWRQRRGRESRERAAIGAPMLWKFIEEPKK
ncbi:hypothetical protein Nepgr_009392 [Nepenthes gracilis]|uniref:Uncharacterized protein n=1 Tax=Nepenthes gracilis TaxID=150966 RepID=A0AAD3SAS8_NEPGR|nr:hypothetical protein Nepgr_009392 [Nepenthes gracilis]